MNTIGQYFFLPPNNNEEYTITIWELVEWVDEITGSPQNARYRETLSETYKNSKKALERYSELFQKFSDETGLDYDNPDEIIKILE